MHKLAAALLACALSPGWAQDTAAYQGSWLVKWTNQRGVEREGQLELNGDTGTWKALTSAQRTSPSQTDPCERMQHAVRLDKSTPESLEMVIERSKTLAGCTDGRLVLVKQPDGSLKGQFGSGQPLTAAKR